MPTPVPPKWKTAAIVWLAIYPTITGITFFFGDWLFRLGLPLRTLITTGIAVPLMIYVWLPALYKLFAKWLYK